MEEVNWSFGTDRDAAVPSHANGVYLDYAGAALPPAALLRSFMEDLLRTPFGNAHSGGTPSGKAAASIIQEARQLICHHFDLSYNEYEVIFTSGATGALRLLADSLPWSSSSSSVSLEDISHDDEMKSTSTEFWYSQNVHTSVLGIRDTVVSSSGSSWRCLPHQELYPSFVMDPSFSSPEQPSDDELASTSAIIAVPGECNFSGSRLDWNTFVEKYITSAKKGVRRWWILDAAKSAGVPCHFHRMNNEDTARKGLSILSPEHRPQFITFSAYKIFGHPTGLGALLVRRDTLPYFKKCYYGGGTLLAGAADTGFRVPRPLNSASAFEDGSAHTHGLLALVHGFRWLESVGGLAAIDSHALNLTSRLVSAMSSLHHKPFLIVNQEISDSKKCITEGYPLIRFFGETNTSAIRSGQACGATISFSLRYANGTPVSFFAVERAAVAAGISLRTGCLCNLGGCQAALGMSAESVKANYNLGRVCGGSMDDDGGDDAVAVINGRSTGAVRVSLGYGSSWSDCEALITVLRGFLDTLPPAATLSPLLLNALKATDHGTYASSTNSTLVDSSSESEYLFWNHKPQSFPLLQQEMLSALNSKSDSQEVDTVKLAAMYVYPVKSAAGVRVNHWPLTSQGLLCDRLFAIVTPLGRVLTQKQSPQLALLQPSFLLDTQSLILCLSSPFNSSVLHIPLSRTSPADTGCDFNVCGRATRAVAVSVDADEWISEFMHRSTSLKTGDSIDGPRKSYRIIRCTDLKKETSSEITTTKVTNFANTAPLLLLSLESVSALIEMIRQSEILDTSADVVKVENFRPNLLVRGGRRLSPTLYAPHQEDSWNNLRILSSLDSSSMISFSAAGPCARCSMVNVNGGSGAMDCRVFDVLKDYRRDGSSVYFGQFLSISSSSTGYSSDMDNWSFACGEDNMTILGLLSTSSSVNVE